MQNSLRGIVLAAVTVCSLGTLKSEPPNGSDPLLQCHRVFSEVGLIVRSTASAEGRKVGKLSKGDKVQLAGEELAGTGAVYPMIKTDDEGSYWVKIKAPTAGYVLYTTDDDSDYHYIVPCKQ